VDLADLGVGTPAFVALPEAVVREAWRQRAGRVGRRTWRGTPGHPAR
jgi:hypothetical protein